MNAKYLFIFMGFQSGIDHKINLFCLLKLTLKKGKKDPLQTKTIHMPPILLSHTCEKP